MTLAAQVSIKYYSYSCRYEITVLLTDGCMPGLPHAALEACDVIPGRDPGNSMSASKR